MFRNKSPSCLKCGSDDTTKDGTVARGGGKVQRYRCNTCGHSYNQLQTQKATKKSQAEESPKTKPKNSISEIGIRG